MIPDYLSKIFKEKQENKSLQKLMGDDLVQKMKDGQSSEVKVIEVEKFK